MTVQPPVNLEWWLDFQGTMLSAFAKNRDALQALTADRRLSPSFHVWHIWTVTMPRRTITGRLVWGTVLRRRDNGRWIYKQYVEHTEIIERRRAVRALVSKSKSKYTFGR